MAALYDLGSQRPTYDFCIWLEIAWQLGHREVAIRPGPNEGFQPQPHPPADPCERRMMLENVMLPAIPRFGMTLVDKGDEGFPAYHRAVVENYRKGLGLKRPEPSEKARRLVASWCPKPYVTITLRESGKLPVRNGNREAWEQLRSVLRYPVHVVPDTDHANEGCGWAAINLDLRLALYEGAAMNFGVSNGPMGLLTLTEAPYCIFKQIVPSVPSCTERWWAEKILVPKGQQFPWATDRQRMMWQDDTPGNLIAAAEAFGLCR